MRGHGSESTKARWGVTAAAIAAAALGALLLARLGPGSPPDTATSESAADLRRAASPTPGSAGTCATCHGAIVEAYRGHGMSRSVGRPEGIRPGTVTNPITKVRYDVATNGDAAWLTATFPDGGTRRQRIVGRIGAGIFDTSWVGTEVDPASGVATGRLFFAPVETVTGAGLQLAPFDVHPGSPGVDMPLTTDCVTCHTLDRMGGGGKQFPAHQLGADAFESLSPLTCSACHGDTARHVEIMRGAPGTSGEGFGVTRLGRLPPGTQRDVCARCHLQGDARIDLVNGAPDRAHPLAGQIPVLVPRRSHTDFRFVGQLERLALSGCFKSSPSMTCTTCHDPHSGARAQGTESFDRACVACHQKLPAHTTMTGCAGCHMRRSQPFDLPHIVTADHFIRRRIEPPQHDVPHRQFAAREGDLVLYDDGRLRPILQSTAGRRWASGVTAMGLLTMGRFAEAARHLDAFPPPGSGAARTPSAPAGLAPLETSAAFHTVRGFVLIGSGRLDDALAAFSDAIAIDPNAADARMARARLLVDAGDLRGAGLETEAVIRAYPLAEQPWDLRMEIAERMGRFDLALSAADASTRLWPSNPRTWAIVAVLASQQGQADRARRAQERARALSPSVAGGSRSTPAAPSVR